MKQHLLIGSYETNPVKVWSFPSHNKTSKTAIFIHGLYGHFDPLETTDKVNLAIKKLTEAGIAHCVVFNTSRSFDFGSDMDFTERKKAFERKTFIQELDDIKSVIKWVIEKDEQTRLYIHGNSLGGTFATLLKEFFMKIDKISLCGSGCGTNGSAKPILSTYPPEEEILNSIANFKGELLLIQGDEDTTVPKESGMKIIKNAIHAKTSVIIVPGANHSFSKLFGIETEKVAGIFASTVFDFFSKT